MFYNCNIYIKNFYPYMHSLKVIKCIKNTIYGQNDLTWTLLDLIVLDNIFKQNLRSDIKVCYFKRK